MPRVSLLTSTLGAGHLRVAQAIEAALLERCPGAAVDIVDFWSLMDESVARTVRAIYLKLAEENSDLYGRLFRLDQRAWRLVLSGGQMPQPLIDALHLIAKAHLTELRNVERGVGGHLLDRLLFRMLSLTILRGARKGSANAILLPLQLKACWASFGQHLAGRFRAFSPDLVVATQMLPAALFSDLKVHQGFDLPAIAVLTDFGMHDFWIQPGIDTYCVPHESIPGLPPESERGFEVRVTGIPLMPGFRDLAEAQAARDELGLDPTRPVALVLGGGRGLGVEPVAKLLARSSFQLLVLTGGNEAAHHSLAKLVDRYPDKVRIWGWTDRMELFLCAADLVVGKPGGVTLAESLACQRPFLATLSLHGQEDFNTRFIEHQGVGLVVTLENLLRQADSLFADPDTLGRIRCRASAVGHPDAAADVVDAILTHLEPGRPRLAEEGR